MELKYKILGITINGQDLMGNYESETDAGLRIFNTVSGLSLMGIVLQEQDDSFLIGLPAKLMVYPERGPERVVEPHVPVPFIRSFKHTMLTVMPLFGEYEAYYTNYLLKEGLKIYPEIFTEKFLTILNNRLKFVRKTLELLAQEEQERIRKDNEEGAELLDGPNDALDIDDPLILPPSKTRH